MKKIKICLIPYLNASVLQYDFLFSKYKNINEYITDYPCKCAEKMAKNEIDLALIPSIEFQNLKNVEMIKNFGIISKNKVESVLLISKKKKIEEIKKIGLTDQSRTSVALLKILLMEKYGINPTYEVFSDLDFARKEFDSFLVIGDLALTENFENHYIFDLATEWYNWQKLPFVFAFWTIRMENYKDKKEVEKVLNKSYENGMKNMDKILDFYSKKLNLRKERIYNYLTNSLTFKLKNDGIKSLEIFYNLCYKNKLIKDLKPIK